GERVRPISPRPAPPQKDAPIASTATLCRKMGCHHEIAKDCCNFIKAPLPSPHAGGNAAHEVRGEGPASGQFRETSAERRIIWGGHPCPLRGVNSAMSSRVAALAHRTDITKRSGTAPRWMGSLLALAMTSASLVAVDLVGGAAPAGA